ncbi:MAG TPA: sigma-54 dependent transcriptional regulator [Bryobacteraceae bacterium]|nr:sigma-54 dependent transcriptional regulator [Bryobacteraceae bacterium]
MFQTQKRVLVVDDELNQRTAVAAMIDRWGFQTLTAADGMEALERLREFTPDAIVTDLMMPRMDGMQLLVKLKEEEGGNAPAVIVLTGYGSLDTAVTTVHEYGAFWFVEKPIRPRAFRALLDRAVAHRRLGRYNECLERQLTNQGVFSKLCGKTKQMQEVFFLIRQAAPTRANILITGDSGTGKELVARAIHDASPRQAGPFVAVNCAALPETLIESELFGHEKGAFTGALNRRAGCFELAHEGTLFLDEIGDMPLALQSKLLRVLETRHFRRLGGAQEIEVDVRLVAATNRVLADSVRDGSFREDLYFRLSVLEVPLPPLRERLDDLPELCDSILRDLKTTYGSTMPYIHPDVLDAFRRHPWPGNVRELRNVLERALVLSVGSEIVVSHLPQGFGTLPHLPPKRSLGPTPSVTLTAGTSLEDAELEMIHITMAFTNNNRARAAEILGIDPKTLYNKLKERSTSAGE